MVILDKSARADDLRAMAVQRIPVTGVLASRWFGARRPTPREYLFVRDSLVARAVGGAKTGNYSAILKRFTSERQNVALRSANVSGSDR